MDGGQRAGGGGRRCDGGGSEIRLAGGSALGLRGPERVGGASLTGLTALICTNAAAC